MPEDPRIEPVTEYILAQFSVSRGEAEMAAHAILMMADEDYTE